MNSVVGELESINELEKINPANPLVQVLQELKSLLISLDHEQFSSVISEIFTSCIGSHVRHILDHVRIFNRALLEGIPVSYDERERGIPIEKDRIKAADEIDRLIGELKSISINTDDRVIVSTYLSPDLPPFLFVSTAGREIAFLLSHTVHHNAVISGILKENGILFPENFGIAPSTIRYLSKLTLEK